MSTGKVCPGATPPKEMERAASTHQASALLDASPRADHLDDDVRIRPADGRLQGVAGGDVGPCSVRGSHHGLRHVEATVQPIEGDRDEVGPVPAAQGVQHEEAHGAGSEDHDDVARKHRIRRTPGPRRRTLGEDDLLQRGPVGHGVQVDARQPLWNQE